jgi:DNA polymerase-3 subunit delta
MDYLAEPAPSTCLVFAGSKLDARTRFAKALNKAGKVHVFKKLYPRQLIPWLSERAAGRGKRLEAEAADYLSELAGLGLGALDSELEKLSLFVGQEKVIGLQAVKNVVGSGRLYSIFDFTDALAGGNLQRALTSLDQLMALGEPPVRALAMVVRLFRQLMQVRAILDQGGDQSEVQRALRTPPAATRSLMQRAQRETIDRLTAKLARILDCDLDLKSSPGADRIIMERLVMDLCA